MRALASVAAPAAGLPDDAQFRDFIDIVGRSGRIYRFSRLRAGYPLSPVGGTYMLARETRAGLEFVHIATAESLAREAEDAALAMQASQLFSRLNVSGRSRDNELADILAALRPPVSQVLDAAA